MISRYRVSLAGVQLDSLDDNLMILDVNYSPVERNIREQSTANLDGYDVSNEYAARRTVTVSFELHIYDVAERNAACQKVNAWAQNGGTLKVNDRDGQELEVVVDQYAEITSARDWTAPVTIVFASSASPYWKSEKQTTMAIEGKSASGLLKLDGNTKEALVSVSAVAAAAVSSLQVTVGGTMIKLTGLSVATGQRVVIDYINGRILRIRANGASVMNQLDPTSSDNLSAPCGKNTRVSFVSNNKMIVTFSARGLWL